MNKKRKKHSLVSKELRDQEKQEKRVERRGSQDPPPPEKAQARQPSEQSTPLFNFEGETSTAAVPIPLPSPNEAPEVAQAVGSENGAPAGVSSNLAEAIISLPDDELDIPAGQQPRDTPPAQSTGNCPLGLNINSQLAREGSIEDITIAAMNAYYESKAKSKAAPKKKSK